MASLVMKAGKSRVSGGRDEIYVAALPLRAAKGPAQMLLSAAYSLNLWDLQHYMVIIRPISHPQSQVFVFDFQPQDPENIYVALAALSGRGVPGALFVRKLAKLPKSKCWMVGLANVDAVDAASEFNESWQTDLIIGQHDCRDYTNGMPSTTGIKCFNPFSVSESYFPCHLEGLVEHLTSKKYALERLRGNVDSKTRTSGIHTSVRFQNRVDRNNGPLTLAGLGFKCEVEKANNDKKDKLVQLKSAIEVPKNILKQTRSSRVKVVGLKSPLEIEAAPFAAKTFSELGLPPLLIERLEREGFTVPTDVQSTAIPTISQSHDVVIQSYTGSGKTLAYVLPILSEVGPLKKKSCNGEELEKKIGIEAVIVAPSRELAMQIVREVEKLLGSVDKKLVQQLVGGANRSRQEEALRKNKPAIVVGTPGRIAEISAAGKLHTHYCRFLVLDEVDVLLSFNFREDMHRILEHVGRRSDADPPGGKNIPLARRAERQTIMVSATVPFSVIRAARSWGRDPLLVRAKSVVSIESVPVSAPVSLSGPSSNSEPNSQTQGAVESLPPALKHYYCMTKSQHKIDTLRRCIHALDSKSVIAFMNHTRRLKDAVFKLEARGIKAAELHGDLGKLVRSTTLKKFKDGEVRVLVTNELSARGLDVSECDLVVNLDLPTDSIHYAHRAGRTGRLGRKGSVVTICEESEVFVVKKLRRQLGVPIRACEFTEGKLVVSEEEKTLELPAPNRGLSLFSGAQEARVAPLAQRLIPEEVSIQRQRSLLQVAWSSYAGTIPPSPSIWSHAVVQVSSPVGQERVVQEGGSEVNSDGCTPGDSPTGGVGMRSGIPSLGSLVSTVEGMAEGGGGAGHGMRLPL
ncbi:hypothetical protein HHK36_023953 [Tetracentron sinense]|uniref:RNA helicase n=1 Tax=Tetracentron sinense TaxID=13715 RepID=A0A834YR50_TETSI|nr:hypothetical protein HHK36_023953 [Tetracentron sinense]